VLSELKPPFRVRVWCRDCTGEDDKGCFDGGTEWIGPDGVLGWGSPAEFATLEEARKAGDEKVSKCGPWEFDVIDANDEEVDRVD
jgi:hypothetical protein